LSIGFSVLLKKQVIIPRTLELRNYADADKCKFDVFSDSYGGWPKSNYWRKK
jgi:hypothetical protein